MVHLSTSNWNLMLLLSFHCSCSLLDIEVIIFIFMIPWRQRYSQSNHALVGIAEKRLQSFTSLLLNARLTTLPLLSIALTSSMHSTIIAYWLQFWSTMCESHAIAKKVLAVNFGCWSLGIDKYVFIDRLCHLNPIMQKIAQSLNFCTIVLHLHNYWLCKCNTIVQTQHNCAFFCIIGSGLHNCLITVEHIPYLT